MGYLIRALIFIGALAAKGQYLASLTRTVAVIPSS